MDVFRARLRRVGGSLGLLVPKRVVDDLRAGEGSEVEVAILPPRGGLQARLESAIGSLPSLARKPFVRDRRNRF